ncbi:hypothetical protein TH61_17035 [Rufibacter sp. DG15C]|uniref:hypothetical protein n=1 Tax=Rufibacter sp. DG15C TaxID=1379909 RepID=UPI00078C325C|nr:hypothetical protein [Rufibacter sp. DG15C]AMM52547.1 hypothetical protein TH61_17035 [Rufibacter sp. DG15C]
MKEEFDLNSLPKHHGYQVPEDYFDKLPLRIMQRTAYAAPVAQPQTAWFWQLKTAFAGAGLALVFAASFLITQYTDQTLSTQEAMAQVSQKDIYQYLVNQEDLQTADLAEVTAVNPSQSLEFLDVRTEDVSEIVTQEMLEEQMETTPNQ